MFLGIYDYTVILTYISLGISVFGISRALEGDFKVAIFCLALSGLCDMFDGKIGALMFYSVASVIRLAYFNVSETKRQNETSENRQYYQGLPITSMAIILPFLYLMRRYCGLYFLIVIHIAVIIVGLLFILDIKVKKPQNPVRILLVAVVALALAKMFRLI